MMRITIFSELAKGGIADYAHDQANALAARGLNVEMLCSPSFLEGRDIHYKTRAVLSDPRASGRSGSPVRRKVGLAVGILKTSSILCSHVASQEPDAVLMHFSEYLAPLWAWRLRKLRRDGITFHSVLHDPVRDYKVGPGWWHELSVSEAFSVLDSVFVHTRESVEVPETVKAVWVPYGVHSFPAAARSRLDVRREHAIPDVAKLLTAFGYIRDNKNLDLILRAMTGLKDVFLIVAGSEQGGRNKPISHYQKLAEKLGCAERCRWIDRFLSPEETADILCASDLSALTYSRSFVSSSSALGVSANYNLPCLISSGSQTTQAVVRRYDLGIWVEPDSVEAIRAGLQKWLREGISPDWASYKRENSWVMNAELVHQTLLATNKRNDTHC